MLTVVFSIHCCFFIVLATWLEICRTNEYFFFTMQMRARPILRGASEVLRARAQFAQDWNQVLGHLTFGVTIQEDVLTSNNDVI